MAAKAATIRSLIATVCTTGTDIQAPSVRTTLAFNKSLFAALRPKGRAWMSYWTAMAVCFPGHAIDLLAVTQREALLSVRRQARRERRLHEQIVVLRRAAQSPHGGGPVSWLFQTLQQLHWHWPSPGILQDDWGTTLHWLSDPPGCFGHMLRASQRLAFLRKKNNPNRHDLGFLATVCQGVDTFATTWLSRTKGALKRTAWEICLLANYTAGWPRPATSATR